MRDVQHTLKRRLKLLILPSGSRPLLLRRGPAKGIVMDLEAQTHVQVVGASTRVKPCVLRRDIGTQALICDIDANIGNRPHARAPRFARMGTSFEPSFSACRSIQANFLLITRLADGAG